MSSNYVITAENITKKYQIYNKPIDRLKQILSNGSNKYYREFTALNNVNVLVEKGTTVGIIGRNGSGKSTLLQIIAGTLQATTGNIMVNGRISALLELGAGFNPDFTGRENVYLNGAILGLEPKEIDKKFDEILSFSEIGDFIDQPVKTYSSGMFVRLAFSVAALTDPDIVIIDEALSVGDEKFQRKCYNHLETLKEKGCTILFVSHSMKTVEQLCDYAYLLENGQLIGEGEPKDIIERYHARLYSQENEHLKTLNDIKSSEKIAESENYPVSNDLDEEGELKKSLTIDEVKILNSFEEECFVFNSGESSTIQILLSSKEHYDDLTIGVRLKTTHGVEVYGTSTSYYEDNIEIRRDGKISVTFDQNLNLVAGTYHLTVAVAKKLGKNDMTYLDKKEDVLFFKVEEIPVTGTGIANLGSKITIKEG